MGRTRRCVVQDCINNNYSTKKIKKVSYHEVPSEEKRRKKWLKQLQPYVDPCSLGHLFLVCGDHFEEGHFIPSPSKRKILKRDAIPTIFSATTNHNLKESTPVVESSCLSENEDQTEDGAESQDHQAVKEEICEIQDDPLDEENTQYLFNSVKIYRENGQGEICRVCFKPAPTHKQMTDRHVTRTQTYREMMEFLSLDINLDFYPDPVICLNCIIDLLNAFDFKRKCHKTERCLHKYHSNRAPADKPTNLLIVAVGRRKPVQFDQSLQVEATPSTMDHDYTTNEEEEVIELSVEPPTNEDTPPAPPTIHNPRITTWGDPPYLCDVCGRTFDNQRQCRRHLRIHRLEKERVDSYYCAICECTYNNVNVALHQDTHRVKRYECQMCGRRFDRRNLLATHIQGVHEKAAHADCDVCGKQVARRQLSGHMARHFDKKDAKCHICDKLVYRRLLKRHIKLHSQPRRRRTVCHVCGKSVASCLIKTHLNRHDSLPKHRCEVCDVGFFSDKELEVHCTRRKHIRNLMLLEVTKKVC